MLSWFDNHVALPAPTLLNSNSFIYKKEPRHVLRHRHHDLLRMEYPKCWPRQHDVQHTIESTVAELHAPAKKGEGQQ